MRRMHFKCMFLAKKTKKIVIYNTKKSIHVNKIACSDIHPRTWVESRSYLYIEVSLRRGGD